MRAVLHFRPSPALVIASAALIVALADTGWATISQLVPRNSVGTAQLRANAVTSGKIKNGAVGLADLTPAARQPGPAGPQGPPGPAGPQGPAGPSGSVTSSWAVMNQSGSLSRGGGTNSAGRIGPGAYEVIFNRDVTNCSFVASVGETGNGTGGTFGYASAARNSGNANGVRVHTRSSTGVLADRPFHLIVVC